MSPSPNTDGMEIGPDIAAAMGFGSFGAAPKKRKFGADEAFTSNKVQKTAPPAQKEANERFIDPHGPLSREESRKNWIEGRPPSPGAHRKDSIITMADGSIMSANALRRGVRNEKGDIAYFLPSFIEDPWAELKKNKKS